MFHRRNQRPGYALATMLILVGVALFAVGALVAISGLERRISTSQQEGIRSYYVADAGMSDALWQLNTTQTLRDALIAGTLNQTVTRTDKPMAGQGYSIVFASDTSRGQGYGTVTVTATSNNGQFTARRVVTASVFLASSGSVLGESAILAGRDISVTNGSGTLMATDSDLRANRNISFSNSRVMLGAGWLRSVGSITGSTLFSQWGGRQSSNYPAAATTLSVPVINYADLQSSANASYSSGNFANLLRNGGVVTLPGPITYINTALTLSNVPAGTVLRVNGILYIGNNFRINASVGNNLRIEVLDPGNGRAGIIARGSMTFSAGRFAVDGVFHAGGSFSATSLSEFTVNGSVVAASDVAITPGASFSIQRNDTRNAAMFGASGATSDPVQVNHWEEEY
jgi:Tfp pilus assembly protein PilX